MVLGKKKPSKKEKQNSLEEPKKAKKKKKKSYEGSRWGALVLLIVSVVLSLGFYFYGTWVNKSVDFDFGGIINSWEYSR
ncbi:hypothetical protein ACFL1M_04115 [Patescibacteria group bacterium]